jgi:sterol 3beta-glucosyltransferase
MAGDKGGEGRDQSDRAGPSTDRSYSVNLASLDDGFNPPSEIDWEKPPVYELVGSGDNVSTTVVAQGEFRQLRYP